MSDENRPLMSDAPKKSVSFRTGSIIKTSGENNKNLIDEDAQSVSTEGDETENEVFSPPTGGASVAFSDGITTTLPRTKTFIQAASTTAVMQNAADLKTIGFLASICLMANNTIGPALVSTPQLFQQAGWVSPTLVFLFIMVGSSLASTLLCDAMTRIPGNEFYQGRIEMVTLSKFIFPKWGYYVTLLLMTISLQSANIASIIISAQVMDMTVLALFGRTCGIEFYPKPFFLNGFSCVYTAGDQPSPFQGVYILSIGFILVFMLTIPMGFLNLNDNMIIQVGAIGIFLLILVQWGVSFVIVGLHPGYVPAFSSNQTQVLGTVLFNYTFVSTVPSWVNEKKKGVSVNGVIWGSTGFATAIYLIVGILGALAFQYPGDADLLSNMADSTTGILHQFSAITVYLYPIVVLLSTIPVYSIIVRYNLIENKICNKPIANFFAVVLPWLISIPFYTTNGLSVVVNWSSLIAGGFINLVVPFLLYIFAVRKEKRHKKEALEQNKLAINIENAEAEPVERIDSDTDMGKTLVKHKSTFNKFVSYIKKYRSGEDKPFRVFKRETIASIVFVWILVVVLTVLVIFVIGLDIFEISFIQNIISRI